MRKIAIVGAGASGALLAVNLIRNSGGEPLEIILIEKRGFEVAGVAFATRNDLHVLNVPAGKMSAFPDEPDHFLDWLRQRDASVEAGDFVPRRLYGEYLKELLAETKTRFGTFIDLRSLNDEVVAIEPDLEPVLLKMRSGERISADVVVLAFGNFPPPHPTVPDLTFTASDKYIRDPWAPNALEAIGTDESVLIIGTGLSMVDVALALDGQEHKGKITAISTRGLLPAIHQPAPPVEPFYDELHGLTRVTDVFKVVRKHIAVAEANGGNWRAVIDSLRPYTQQLWQGLPTAEKRYFMQHLSRYWNVARHRMPPSAAEKLEEMRKEGRLEVIGGRLRHISLDDDHFLVNKILDGRTEYIRVNTIVNCIGPQSNFKNIDSPLIRDLLGNGYVRCDELLLGLDCTPDGRLISSTGRASDTLHVIGTAKKGILWESTAVPELRQQAYDLSVSILQGGVTVRDSELAVV
jgi:uncharacterized NAD(P)/FAD-binding protein YdhS